MSEPFLGEIRAFSFDSPPKNWARCNGQFLPINQNQALFSILGTTYGGNGLTTFALPDLRGRAGFGAGGPNALGQKLGTDQHILTPATENLNTVGSLQAKRGLAVGAEQATVSNDASAVSIGRQPYLVLNFCIALAGVLPSSD